MSDENKLFHSRPDYTGPTSGYFGLPHQTVLAERSNNVMKLVEYVHNNKPKIAIHLHNMIYLWEIESLCDERYAIDAKCRQGWYAIDAKWWQERDAIEAKIIEYIKTKIPDCA